MARIDGRVLEFRSGLPATMPPIAGARVQAFVQGPRGGISRNPVRESNDTGIDGSYTIDLPPSNYVLIAVHPSYRADKPGRTRTIQIINPNDDKHDMNFILQPPAPPRPTRPREVDVGQKPHPELGDEKAWKQRTGNIPGETFRTESQVTGAGGGPIQLAGGGAGTAPIRIRTEKEPEKWGIITGKTVKQGTIQGVKTNIRVVEVNYSWPTRSDGNFQIRVPADASYTLEITAKDYKEEIVHTPQVLPVPPNPNTDLGNIELVPETTAGITGFVADEEGKPVQNAEISLTGPRTFGRPYRTPDGRFNFRNLQPGIYQIKASHPDYEEIKDQSSKEIDLVAGKTEQVRLRLKRKKKLGERWKKGETKLQKGIPIFRWSWWWDNRIRLVITLVATFVIYFVFYKPIILDGLGLDDPYRPFTPFWLFLNFFVPFVGLPLIIFAIAKPKEKLEDWGPLVLAAIVGGVVLFASTLPPFRFLGSSLTIRFGVPLILALITWYIAEHDRKAGKGLGPMFIRITSIMFLLGVLLFGINLITSGAFLNIETYLRPLDVLHVIGVPQDTIDGFKDGVRSVLSFLQFKAVEPTKPEAKKIGGFEAIQLKFGSKYNDYLLPTLFARMDYTLPVTVTNPNKFDTKLVVEKFNITDIFLNNRSDNRILCGSIGESPNGKIELGDVNPEDEKMTTVEFKGKTLNDLNVDGKPDGTSVNCKSVLTEAGKTSVTNPMYPDKFRLPFEDKTPEDKTKDCIEVCKDKGTKVVSNHNTRYGLTPGDELDTDGSRYISTDNECECKVKRFYNIMDNLCFMDNNKAKITLTSSYGFKVQGKGELILVKTDADRKLAPKPSITSSAGPLTVTTYFVSDTHVFESGVSKTTKMFVQIENDGDGSAKIEGVKINSKIVPKELPVQLLDTSDKIKITRCLPDPTRLTISKETISAVCDVEIKIETGEISSIVTGTYRTLPVIVDVDYTYSQTHSTTINVKKASIPEEVTDPEQIAELKRQFEPLPYYCQSDLKIYNP